MRRVYRVVTLVLFVTLLAAFVPLSGKVEAASDLTLTPSSSTIHGGHIGSPGTYPSPGAGSFYTLAILHDPDGGPPSEYNTTVTWGDGTTSTCTGTTCSADLQFSCTVPGGGCYINGLHSYAAAGRYTATVTVNDTDATSTTTEGETPVSTTDLIYFDLSVTGNCTGASPASTCSATPPANLTGTTGTAVSGPVAFLTDGDAPALSNFTVTINWGDGTTSAPTSVSCSTGCVVNGSHVYATAGTYTVTTTAQDMADGFSSTNACPATANGRASCTPITATISGASTGTAVLQKTVDGLLCPSGQGCTANPGERLTYQVGFTPQAAVTSATITDVLQTGQSLYALSSNCTAGTVAANGTQPITCTASNVGAGQTAVSTIITTVTGAAGTTITNQASVAATSTSTAATSNATSVTVAGAPTPSPGTFTICGPTTSTSTTITVAGNTFPLASGVIFTGAQGGNYCVTLTFTNGAVSSISYTPNLAAPVTFVCGPFTAMTTTTVTVGGFVFPSIMVTTSVTLTVGATFCFVIGPSGQIISVLSTVPTSAYPVRDHYRIGRLIAY